MYNVTIFEMYNNRKNIFEGSNKCKEDIEKSVNDDELGFLGAGRFNAISLILLMYNIVCLNGSRFWSILVDIKSESDLSNVQVNM